MALTNSASKTWPRFTGIYPTPRWSSRRSPTGKARWSMAARSAPRPASHTGRSPKDKFVVVDAQTEKTVWWEKNGRLAPEKFQLLLDDFIAHAKGKTLYAQDLYGGADPKYRIKTRVYNELAWHSLFIRALLIRPARGGACRLRARFHHPVAALVQGRSQASRRAQRDRDRDRLHPAHHPDRRHFLCRRDEEVGVHHAQLLSAGRERDADALLGQCRPGRRRRAVLRPVRHRQDHAVGRSQPHADRRRRARLGPARRVQFRGRLLRQVHQAVARRRSRRSTPRRNRFGAVLENVVFDPDDARLRFRQTTQDREYPRRLSARVHSATPRAPAAPASRRTSCFLTADAFGVMPPIAKLTPAQAMYHFLSGYTAKVAGTEKGLVGVEPEFSTCFGAPFLPRHPSVYGNLLRELISEARCRLLAGQYRLDRRHLRRRPPHADQGDAHAAHRRRSTARCKNAKFRTDPYFGFCRADLGCPASSRICSIRRRPGRTSSSSTRPRASWSRMFQKNFVQFEKHVDADVRAAAPEVRIAAE